MGTYTLRKVHQPLADALDSLGDPGTVTTLHIDRYSVQDGAGIVSQVARHAACYPTDPDVQVYRAMPEEAFARSVGNVRLVSPAELHHALQDRQKTIALTRIGGTLFVRVEMSAVARAIVRPDGEDENAYTAMILALLSHHPRLREARWAGDLTRFARDAVNASLITRKLRERNVVMYLSGTPYDLADDANVLLLGVQSAVGANDDPTRRRKLVGSKLLKMAAGGAVTAEDQLPYGYRIQRRDTGQPVKSGEKGLNPIPDLTVMDAIRTAYMMYADGETYGAICQALAGYEAAGEFQRRPGPVGYARTFTEVAAQHDVREAQAAVKRLFAPATLPRWLPHPEKPSGGQIAAYLAGGDPADVFTIEQQLLIARVELMRTGTYLRVLRNELRQRNFTLHGFTATYLNDADDYGYFSVRAVWERPIDPATGEPGWGVDDDVFRRAAARLLTCLDQGRQPTGSRAHQARTHTERRAIQNIPAWADGGYAHKAVARQETKKRKANVILLRRPVADSQPLPGTATRGWGRITDHIVATFALPALCTDLAQRITEAVESIIAPDSVAPASVALPSHDDRAADVRVAMLARADQVEKGAAEDEKAAAGARRLAALVAADDPKGAEAYIADARSNQQSAVLKHAEAARIRDEVAQEALAARSAPAEATADVSLLAYLVAGLIRAGRNRGFGPPVFGETADRLLTSWRFRLSDDEQWVTYTCTVTLPLVDGRDATVPLTGRVPNVRSVRGRKMTRRDTLAQRRETTYAALILRDGKSVEAAVEAMGDAMTRKHALTLRVRPWLGEQGVQSRGLRSAIVDHPIALAQKVVYEDLTGEKVAEIAGLPAGLRAWREHVAAVYRSDMQWGDAAVPDNLDVVRSVVATLAADPTTGVTPAEIARTLGWSEPKTRSVFGTPQPRPKGFQRPRYTAYVGTVGRAGKGTLGAINCPHRRCRGLCDEVVLLPEVAASGYGVICSTCRRAPNTEDPKWAKIVFPPAYLEPWTRQVDNGSLSDRSQTMLGELGRPFDVLRVQVEAECPT